LLVITDSVVPRNTAWAGGSCGILLHEYAMLFIVSDDPPSLQASAFAEASADKSAGTTRDREVVSRLAHNQEIAGAIPAPATLSYISKIYTPLSAGRISVLLSTLRYPLGPVSHSSTLRRVPSANSMESTPI
jgi:hypothetical protein